MGPYTSFTEQRCSKCEAPIFMELMHVWMYLCRFCVCREGCCGLNSYSVIGFCICIGIRGVNP
ncbi:hypothetical protein STEG23_029071, partial [Scotinomys teguina]